MSSKCFDESDDARRPLPPREEGEDGLRRGDPLIPRPAPRFIGALLRFSVGRGDVLAGVVIVCAPLVEVTASLPVVAPTGALWGGTPPCVRGRRN